MIYLIYAPAVICLIDWIEAPPPFGEGGRRGGGEGGAVWGSRRDSDKNFHL